jgi:SH3-like domain-containing protein
MAFDFGSVTRDAVLFENSSQNARKLAILRPGTPVEIVVTSPDLRWIKVRDPSGALSWIEGNAVGKQRTVLVTVDQAAVRREAKADSPIVFEAIRDVVLEFVSLERGGWVKVRHVDGESGFVRSSEVWGL